MIRFTIAFLSLALPLFANFPGGGPSAGGADVTLTDNGSTITLANGTLSATVIKDNAEISSLLFNGIQLVRSGGNIYYSMDGGSNYRRPSGCAYSVTTNTSDMVDIGMRQTWGSQAQPLDIEIHYVLRRGDTGLYTYAILDHPAGYPAGGYGEWRMVWKLPDDTFERLYVDNLRNRQMPTAADYAAASSTSIAEIVHLNTGVLAGQDEGKYCYNANYHESPVYGHASNVADTGVWLVFGAHEWFNDGPFKQDLAPADRILHVHFGMNHFNGSGLSIAAGESWRKLYGPYLLYCNTNPAGAETCWQDAQAQAGAERNAWPYDWLTGNPDYPTAAQRATVSGTIDLNDPLKPSLDATGAWVGLAAPDPGGSFQFESERYQHWVRAGSGGNFTIPHVRPGTYMLSCVAEGATGEFEYTTPVTVTAGQTLNLGTLTWAIPRSGSWLAWEIGLPDRDSREFRHGNDYWVPFVWTRFDNEFSNPLNYDVSASLPATDWNFAHCGYEDDGGTRSTWPWHIHFDLPSLPASGNARLILAFAGSDHSRMQIFINSASQFGPNLYPAAGGGNALLRQSSHAKYSLHTIDIPVSSLKVGANVITLLQGRYEYSGDHVMYDYLALEMPGLPGGNPSDGDGDGLADLWELEHFLTLSETAAHDPDGDGFTNAEEEAGNSDPNDDTSLPWFDADGDVINDVWELIYYPSPFTAAPLDDTDGDGFDTWTEWKAGSDPSDNTSKPGPTTGSTSIEPVADTAVWYRSGQPAFSSTNYGSDPDIDNYAYPGVPIVALGYFRFDLSSLPPGAMIDAATLTLTKVGSNPQQSPQGVHSDNADTLTTGRFAIYGMTDVAGNTAQDWNESTLTGDATGAEFDFANAGSDPPLDTASRTLDLDGVGETVGGTTASISDGALVPFLQGRFDATSHPGLATFITDIESGSNGKGYAFVSREGTSGSRPTLAVAYTTGIPLPDPDEDGDGVDDAWEAHHLGTLAGDGNGDAEGDGTPDWLEFHLGLDPNDPGEHFRATIVPDGDGFLIQWPNGEGLTFTVESTTTLQASSWSGRVTIPGAATPNPASHPFTDTDPRHFYRIRVSRP